MNFNAEFKVGSKVRCICEPPAGSYYCKIGEILEVRTSRKGIFWATESPKDRNGMEYPTNSWCALSRYFEEVRQVTLTDIYNSF